MAESPTPNRLSDFDGVQSRNVGEWDDAAKGDDTENPSTVFNVVVVVVPRIVGSITNRWKKSEGLCLGDMDFFVAFVIALNCFESFR